MPQTHNHSNVLTRLLTILYLTLAACQQAETTHEAPPLRSDVVDSTTTAMAPNIQKKYSLDEMYRKYISEELLSYIEKTHATWSVPSQNKWYPKLFDKYKTNTSLVNYVRGDFDCNGKVDDALIVDKGHGNLGAVAFLRSDKSFKTVQLTEFKPGEEEKINFVLTLYKPGRYDIADPDLSPSDQAYVNLKCSGVGIGMFKELYEGGDDVFYWEGDQLRSCVIEK